MVLGICHLHMTGIIYPAISVIRRKSLLSTKSSTHLENRESQKLNSFIFDYIIDKSIFTSARSDWSITYVFIRERIIDVTSKLSSIQNKHIGKFSDGSRSGWKFLRKQNKPKEDFLRIFKNAVLLETVETTVIIANDGSQTPNNFKMHRFSKDERTRLKDQN
jgi:hypothetical protein